MKTIPVHAAAPSIAMGLLEADRVPDWLIRSRIRKLLRERLAAEDRGDPERQQQQQMRFIGALKASPIAIDMTAANEQHYELPTEFFQAVLGPHLKYSACYYDAPTDSLDAAEARMLALTCERARIADGERVLELGCGWGSLSLWMAAHYPRSQITAVSNSRTQKMFIDAEAVKRGLSNLKIITCDMNVLEFPPDAAFDRVVSVEMFEHMRNYEQLLARVATWMAPGATLFVHIFTHRQFAYPFDIDGADDWMARYFFTGGIMPSDDLLLYFQRDVELIDHWRLCGRHYQLTSDAWLANMDRQRPTIMPLMARTYGEREQLKWWVYWRVFFMACSELWGYGQGREWIVSHYLFQRR
jgi:cyclopropane-fatty-acyl-phospholipid synthase